MAKLDSINDSIENKLILADFFKNAEFFKDKRDRLIKYTGGFAVAYPCLANGEKWAFRCWYNDLDNLKERYQKLDNAIKQKRLPYFCDFTYLDDAILIDGNREPITYMKWIEGNSIFKYLADNAKNKNKIVDLKNEFLNMCKLLNENEFSHGDLQHGNIMVDNKGKIFLIDYDSLYHSSMGDYPDYIKGLDDYQHPSRKLYNPKATIKADYFSQAIIYTTILAVENNPDLVDENHYNLGGEDAVLFNRQDYIDFAKSKVYKDVEKCGRDCKIMLFIISEYLKCSDINYLNPFTNELEKYGKKPEILNFDYSPNGKIFKGEKVTLNWTIKNAISCKLDGKNINTNSFEFILNEDRDFKLEASNGFEVVSKTISIEVSSLKIPEISLQFTAPKIEKQLNINIEFPKFSNLQIPNIELKNSTTNLRLPNLKLNNISKFNLPKIELKISPPPKFVQPKFEINQSYFQTIVNKISEVFNSLTIKLKKNE